MTTPPGALSAALADLWGAIRERYPDLPGARVVVVPGRQSSDHGPGRWGMTEDGFLTGLTTAADTLRDGPEAALAWLLHEAAHVRCWLRGETDTSQRGQYHNLRFLTAAVDVGLAWAQESPTSSGYSGLGLPRETAALYKDILRPMGPVIDVVLPHLDVSQPRQPSAQRLSIGCQCDPPRLARMTRTALERGPLACGVCRQEFKPM